MTTGRNSVLRRWAMLISSTTVPDRRDRTILPLASHHSWRVRNFGGRNTPMARLRKLTVLVAVVVALVLTVWATGALYFDSPFPFLRAPAAGLYLAGVLAALW